MTDIITYIRNPEKLGKESIAALEQVVKDYPYFQMAHLLLAKNYQMISHEKTEQYKSFVATCHANRRCFYHFLKKDILPSPVQVVDHIAKPVAVEELNTPAVALEPAKARKQSKTQKRILSDDLQDNIANALLNHMDWKNDNKETTTEEVIFESNKALVAETLAHALEFPNALVSDDTEKDFIITDLQLDNERLSLDTDTDIKLIEDDILTFSYSLQSEEIENERSEFAARLENEDIEQEEDESVIFDFADNLDVISADSEINSSFQIIDSFIKSNPSLRPNEKAPIDSRDLSVDSTAENEHYITETLAKIYARQGMYQKAIFAFEKLSLKFPEKSTYFVAQIEQLKKQIENL